MSEATRKQSWLNRTVLGVGLTSLFSDWSHETATAVLPAFLAMIGAGPAWLGAIEGVADGLSSFAKLIAGHYTDRCARPRSALPRKPIKCSSGAPERGLGAASALLQKKRCSLLMFLPARTVAHLDSNG